MEDVTQQFDDGLEGYVDFEPDSDGTNPWMALNFPRTACEDTGEEFAAAFPNVKKKAVSWAKLRTSTVLVNRIKRFVALTKDFVGGERKTIAERVFRCCVIENPDDDDVVYFGPHVDGEGRDGIDYLYSDLVDICGDDPEVLNGISKIFDEIVFDLYITRIYRDSAFDTAEEFAKSYAESKKSFQVLAPACYFNKWLKMCKNVDEAFDVFQTMASDKIPVSEATIGSVLTSSLNRRDYPLLLQKIAELMVDHGVSNILLSAYTELSEYCERNSLFKNSGETSEAAL